MTAVATTDTLSEPAARELVDLIRSTAEILENQIIRAYHGRAWVALGYQSWTELCNHEFTGVKLKLPREDRREFHALLAGSGMSRRAIAAVTGASKNTVTADVSQTGTPDDEPKPRHRPEPGAHCWCTPPCPGFGPDTDEIVVGEIVEKPVTNNVIGLDGKQYPKPAPTPPKLRRRTPITDTAFRLAVDLDRMARRVANFASDDRIADNRERLEQQLDARIVVLIGELIDLRTDLVGGGGADVS